MSCTKKVAIFSSALLSAAAFWAVSVYSSIAESAKAGSANLSSLSPYWEGYAKGFDAGHAAGMKYARDNCTWDPTITAPHSEKTGAYWKGYRDGWSSGFSKGYDKGYERYCS